MTNRRTGIVQRTRRKTKTIETRACYCGAYASNHGVSSGEQVRTVKLRLVGEHVAVRVRRDGEVALADVLADLRPPHSGEVVQRDSAVPEVGANTGTPASTTLSSETKPRLSGAFGGGRYWARTSDPQLVELVLSQLS